MLKRYLFAIALLMLFAFLHSSSVKGQPVEPLFASSVDWSPDGSRIAIIGDGVWIYDHNLNKWERLESNAIGAISWSPDGTKIAVGNEIWDAQTLQILSTVETEMSLGVLPKSWSNDSSRVATLANNGLDIVIFDANDGSLVQTIKGDSIYIDSFDWSPDDSQFIALRTNDTIALMSVNAGTITRSFTTEIALGSVRWHPDGKRFASAALQVVERGTAGSVEAANDAVIFSVQIWDATTGNIVQTFSELPAYPSILRWHPQGTELIGGSANGSIFVLDIPSASLSGIFLSAGTLSDIDYSPLGGRIAITSNLSQLRYADPKARISTVKGQRVVQSLLKGSFEIAVPSPSLETLQGLENQCLPAESERVVPDDERTLPQFRTQLNDLSSEFTHPTCAEELSAVAEAVIAEG